MGIFDKAKDLANQHNDQVDQAIDKMAEVVDDKTGQQHSDQIDQAAQQVKDTVDDTSGHPAQLSLEFSPSGQHEHKGEATTSTR